MAYNFNMVLVRTLWHYAILCMTSNDCMAMDRFYILLIDYGTQVYYWKITKNIQQCTLFPKRNLASFNSFIFYYMTLNQSQWPSVMPVNWSVKLYSLNHWIYFDKLGLVLKWPMLNFRLLIHGPGPSCNLQTTYQPYQQLPNKGLLWWVRIVNLITRHGLRTMYK